MIQLTEDGASLEICQGALLNVEEGPRQGPEPAPALYLLTVELTVREKALRLKIVILTTVGVHFQNIYDTSTIDPFH